MSFAFFGWRGGRGGGGGGGGGDSEAELVALDRFGNEVCDAMMTADECEYTRKGWHVGLALMHDDLVNYTIDHLSRETRTRFAPLVFERGAVRATFRSLRVYRTAAQLRCAASRADLKELTFQMLPLNRAHSAPVHQTQPQPQARAAALSRRSCLCSIHIHAMHMHKRMLTHMRMHPRPRGSSTPCSSRTPSPKPLWRRASSNATSTRS